MHSLDLTSIVARIVWPRRVDCLKAPAAEKVSNFSNPGWDYSKYRHLIGHLMLMGRIDHIGMKDKQPGTLQPPRTTHQTKP